MAGVLVFDKAGECSAVDPSRRVPPVATEVLEAAPATCPLLARSGLFERARRTSVVGVETDISPNGSADAFL